MDLYQLIQEQAAQLVESAKKIISADTPFAERFAILVDTVSDVVLLVERVAAPGPEKRALAQQIIEQLYDILAAYDIPYIPGIIESRIEAHLKPHFVEACLQLVDRLVARFNRTNAWGTLAAQG